MGGDPPSWPLSVAVSNRPTYCDQCLCEASKKSKTKTETLIILNTTNNVSNNQGNFGHQGGAGDNITLGGNIGGIPGTSNNSISINTTLWGSIGGSTLGGMSATNVRQ